MNNYLNIHKLLELYDTEGLQGLKRRIQKRAFYVEDNLTGEVYEMIKNKKYSEVHSLISKIKKMLDK